MRKFLVILFYFASLQISAQTKSADSLKTILETTTQKEQRLSILENLNKILISKSSLKKSLSYFNEMEALAEEFENHELQSRANKYISEVYIKEMDSTNALKYANKALSISEANGNVKNYLLDINQLGRVYYHFQQYENALKTYQKGIDKYNKSKDTTCLATLSQIYSNSSISYDKLGRSEESIQAVLIGIEIAELTNSPTQKCYGLYALGYKYMDLKNYEKAEDYFLKSLRFSDSVTLDTYVYMNHHGLGINYSRWGRYDKALEHNKLALEFYRKKGDKLYEFDVLNNSAVVYQRKNEPDSVVKYSKMALKIAEEINHKLAITGAKLTLSNAYINLKQFSRAEELLVEVAKDTVNPKVIDKNSKAAIFSNFSEIYEGKNDYKTSLKFHKRFKSLNDSINQDINDSKLLETESKYRLEEKNNKILTQKLALEQKDREKNQLIYIISGIALLTLLLGYFLYKRKQQLKIEQKKYISELNRSLRLQTLVKENTNTPQKINGIDDPKFKTYLLNTLNINDDLFDVYVELVKGKSYEKVAKTINLSLSGTKTRINKLYEALKMYSDKDLNEKMTKSQSIKIFNDLLLEYQLKK